MNVFYNNIVNISWIISLTILTYCAILCAMSKSQEHRKSGYGFIPHKVAGALLLTAGMGLGAVRLGQELDSGIHEVDSSPVAALTADLGKLSTGGTIGYLKNPITVSVNGLPESVRPIEFEYDGTKYTAYRQDETGIPDSEGFSWQSPSEAEVAGLIIDKLADVATDDPIGIARMDAAGNFLDNQENAKLPGLGQAELIQNPQG
jgi:hypothetical protein